MQRVLSFCLVLMCTMTAIVAKHGQHWPGKHLNERALVQYKDCNDVRKAGYKDSGVYLVWYNSTTPYKVVCNHTAQASYTVIQRRGNGQENFNRPWNDYVTGFGYTQSEFWAGLNSINYLTSTGQNKMTVDMEDFSGNRRQIKYRYFKVAEADQWYRLTIANAYGNVPDDLGYNNNCYFYTYDKPDPYGCAIQMTAGWWYNYCTFALPNGHYYHGPYIPSTTGMFNGIFWRDWQGFGYSLKFISMTLSYQ